MEDLPLVLRPLVEQVQLLYEQPAPKWAPDRANHEDLQLFKREATSDSVFDPLGLRRDLWQQVESGSAQIHAKSCSYAKVLWIQPSGTQTEPPWDIWGRLVQWAGSAGSNTKWRIFWFPAEIPRRLPPSGQPVGPEHVNGGYCYPCSPHVIVVYRKEEATRVLIHELLHAACTDPPGAPLVLKEATTETWAELFLVAFCSKGKARTAKHLWSKQSAWISSQNEQLRRHYRVLSPEDYAWRYTVGRELILQLLKVPLPAPHSRQKLSSRLTDPSLCP